MLIIALLAGAPLHAGSLLKTVNSDSDTTTLHVSGDLKDQVKYSAQDSIFFDLDSEVVYLYDSAKVDYQDISVQANFIKIDFKNHIVHAEGKRDSLGINIISNAQFTQGDATFYEHSMSYNYVTKKGVINDVHTVEGDGHLLATKVKRDSSGNINGYKGMYTTCDLDHPHFALYAKKMKVIPDDKIITGPAYLEIADVPTPLAIPFGFFPNHKGRANGILIPTYGESPTMGFFLKDGGYYFGLGDKMDMALRGDIYSKGSWGAKVFTDYRVRYKYSGNFSVKYSRFLIGDPELPSRQIRNDFFVNWSHTQDPKANPSVRFAANVNAGSSTYNTFNANSPTNYLANTFQSNVAWSKSWQFGSLSANLRHSQNTQTHIVDMSLPTLAFSMNRKFPFRYSRLKWLSKLGVSYTSEFQNNLNILDTKLALDNMPYVQSQFRNAIRQTIPVSTSLNVLRYFTLTPSFTFNTVTQFKTIRKVWNPATEAIVIDTVNGVRMDYDYSTSVALTTRYYGMYFPSHTRYSAIRHTLTPSFSFTYIPDFTGESFYQTVQTNPAGAYTQYSIFEGGIYGASSPGKIGALGVSLQNSLEAKLRPKADDTSGTAKRVMLIDAFNVGFNYNFMAKHFNWSTVNTTFRTKLFKKLDVVAGLIADPYRINDQGVRIERFEWRQGKRLARLTAATLTMGTSLRKGGLTSSKTYSSNKGTQQDMDMINAHPNAYVDFNIPWSLNMNYSLNWSRPGITTTMTQSITFSGDVNVTPKWKVGFMSSYDLKKDQFGFTSFNVYRDLHCWEMQFNWIPFGFRQSYNITINVKSAVLQDLRLNRKRDWYDFSQ